MNLAQRFGDVKVFWGADHSQLEIRVLAQMSKDPLLMKLIQSGEDIHSSVGTVLTGVPIDQIKKDRETRTAIKGIHFGIIYGLSPGSLYYTLKIQAAERKQEFKMSEAKVTHLYNRYFQKFRGVKYFLDQQMKFAEKHSYVKTLFGFQREISLAGSEDRTTYWKNQAVNSPIQGTAHQLILMSMALMELKKKTYHLLYDMCMEVHDSLIGFGDLRNLPEIYKQVKYLLEVDTLKYVKAYWPDLNWTVPLKAEAKAGLRMGVMLEYAGESAEEFAQKWCEKNHEFEEQLRKDMAA